MTLKAPVHNEIDRLLTKGFTPEYALRSVFGADVARISYTPHANGTSVVAKDFAGEDLGGVFLADSDKGGAR